MTDVLFEKAELILKITEERNGSAPTGACYLFGHCLNEVFKNMGYNSRKVTGHLAMVCKGDKKYVVYGKLPLKGYNVGDYHTWCEVEQDGVWYIVDPSIRHNKVALKSHPEKIKLNSSIPDIIISSEANTFKHKYIVDEKLEKYSLEWLQKLPTDFIDEIINSVSKQ